MSTHNICFHAEIRKISTFLLKKKSTMSTHNMFLWTNKKKYQQFSGAIIDLGPVVQSIVSLTSSLVVEMITVLVSTISNSQVFLLKKM